MLLPTTETLPEGKAIDALSALEAADRMLDGQEGAIASVRLSTTSIAQAADVMAAAIRAAQTGEAIDPAADHYPRAEDGLRSMAAVYAVAESGKANGEWVDARPPMFR